MRFLKKAWDFSVERLWPQMKKPCVWIPVCAVAAAAAVAGILVVCLSAASLPTAASPQTPDALTVTVTVTADGQTQTVTLPPHSTVKSALAAQNIVLDEDDTVWPQAACAAWQGMHITVKRIAYAERTEQITEAFETVQYYSVLLKEGETKVYKEGKPGITEIVYRDLLVDGVVTETQTVSETQTQQREDEVVLAAYTYGVPMSMPPFEVVLNEKGQPVEYEDLLEGKATAYTNDRGLCGTHTSIGLKAEVGVVAVDPSIIPYGTLLYIVSPGGGTVYGYAIAGDTGGAMLSGLNLVDLFMDTYEDCVAFGRRDMNLYVLKYPD